MIHMSLRSRNTDSKQENEVLDLLIEIRMGFVLGTELKDIGKEKKKKDEKHSIKRHNIAVKTLHEGKIGNSCRRAITVLADGRLQEIH